MTTQNDDGAGATCSAALYYEDMVPGESLTSSKELVDRDEMIAFAKVWDPMPFHVDESEGQKAFGGLTAPGIFMLSVKQRLVHRLPRHEVIASLGYDEVRFLKPLRPGDSVFLKEEWVSRRPSDSKPDRGVVVIKFSLINQAGAAVMTLLDTVLVRKRG
jgi:acyl dehydratase